MKTIVFLTITLLCTFAATAQNGRKTNFHLMVGPTYTSKTNLQNGSSGFGASWNEKGFVGFSGQALLSFYLAKKWRLNSGLGVDNKGFDVEGYHSLPADGQGDYYHHKNTAYYLGIPVSVERHLMSSKKLQLSVDAGILPQWKIASTENGQYFLKNQFSFMGGFYGKFPAGRNSILLHPVFRFAVTQLHEPLLGTAKSPNVNAYSIGMELGYQF